MILNREKIFNICNMIDTVPFFDLINSIRPFEETYDLEIFLEAIIRHGISNAIIKFVKKVPVATSLQ